MTRERKQVVRWSGCLAGWVGVAIPLPFSLGKKLAFQVLLRVEASVHPVSIGLGLGEERIGNISSKPPTSVDGGSRTMENMIF